MSCLVSLIRFAREHTENNGSILVESVMKDGQLVCWVEDQGANYTDALFGILSNHFSECETPLDLTMGIGLAVSLMIMESHGGCLIFEKTSDNRGCLKMVFPAVESSS